MDIYCNKCGCKIEQFVMSNENMSKLFLTGIIDLSCKKCGSNFSVKQIVNDDFTGGVGYEL